MAMWHVDGVYRKNGLDPRYVDLRIHGPSREEAPTAESQSYAFEFREADQPVSWYGVSVHSSLTGAMEAADKFVAFTIKQDDWQQT